MADVKIGVTTPAVLTSGIQLISKSGFGTPKGAMFIGNNSTSLNAFRDSSKMFIGAADASAQWVFSIFDLDNVSTSDTERRQAVDECIMWITTAGSVQTECAWTSFGSDGVTVTSGAHDETNREMYAVLFGGDDLTVDVGTFTVGNVNVATNVTAPGFEPDVVIFVTNGNPTNDTATTDARLSFGVAANDVSIVQRCLAYCSNDAKTGSATDEHLFTDRCCADITEGGLVWEGELTAFGANGFSVTPRAGNGGSDVIGYIALNFGGASFEVGSFNTATSTGAATHPASSTGFTSQFVLHALSRLISEDVTSTDANSESFSVGAIDADNRACSAIGADDSANPTNSSSEMTAQAIDINHSATSDLVDATFTSFNSGNWTLNYSLTDPTQFKCWYLTVEEETVPAAAGVATIHQHKKVNHPKIVSKVNSGLAG